MQQAYPRLATSSGFGIAAPTGRTEDRSFRWLFEIAPVILFVLGGDRRCHYVNSRCRNVLGIPAAAALGRGWMELVHPDDAREFERPWREATSSGGGFEAEVRLLDATQHYRPFLVRAVPHGGGGGSPPRWFGCATDLLERQAADERQRAPLMELQHRVRNVLAAVRSIVTRSAETSDDLGTYASHLSGRVGAIARTQGALIRTAAPTVDLESLLREELLAAVGRDVTASIRGPTVPLRGKLAEVLGLAFHELATNAVKFGALSGGDGRLSVRWTTKESGDGRFLDLRWRESGIAVAPDRVRAGFGHQFLEEGLQYDLGASTSLVMEADGLTYRAVIRLAPDGEAA